MPQPIVLERERQRGGQRANRPAVVHRKRQPALLFAERQQARGLSVAGPDGGDQLIASGRDPVLLDIRQSIERRAGCHVQLHRLRIRQRERQERRLQSEIGLDTARIPERDTRVVHHEQVGARVERALDLERQVLGDLERAARDHLVAHHAGQQQRRVVFLPEEPAIKRQQPALPHAKRQESRGDGGDQEDGPRSPSSDAIGSARCLTR